MNTPKDQDTKAFGNRTSPPSPLRDCTDAPPDRWTQGLRREEACRGQARRGCRRDAKRQGSGSGGLAVRPGRMARPADPGHGHTLNTRCTRDRPLPEGRDLALHRPPQKRKRAKRGCGDVRRLPGARHAPWRRRVQRLARRTRALPADTAPWMPQPHPAKAGPPGATRRRSDAGADT